jgi:AraC-like DNA-binding protein
LIYHFYKPHPALKDLIRSYMLFAIDSREGEPMMVCPYLPDPEQFIIFYIRDLVSTQKADGGDFITKPPSMMVGPRLKKINLLLGKDFLVFRVAFQPGGLHRLLGVTMKEMLDEDFDSTLFYDKEIREINEKLKETTSFNTIKDIVEGHFLKKLSRIRPVCSFDFAMKELVMSGGNSAIEKIAALSCLSLRQFERTCGERIGLPPKLFSRLVRFSKAFMLKEKNPQLNWTKISYECGYFDQMHLIRDFREFSGEVPTVIEEEFKNAPLLLQANL